MEDAPPEPSSDAPREWKENSHSRARPPVHTVPSSLGLHDSSSDEAPPVLPHTGTHSSAPQDDHLAIATLPAVQSAVTPGETVDKPASISSGSVSAQTTPLLLDLPVPALTTSTEPVNMHEDILRYPDNDSHEETDANEAVEAGCSPPQTAMPDSDFNPKAVVHRKRKLSEASSDESGEESGARRKNPLWAYRSPTSPQDPEFPGRTSSTAASPPPETPTHALFGSAACSGLDALPSENSGAYHASFHDKPWSLTVFHLQRCQRHRTPPLLWSVSRSAI
jgi:hypothetical protein